MINILSGIIETALSKKIRRCLCCRRVKVCIYIDFKVIENKKHDRGIKGYFCNECSKIPFEDIFTKLKDEQYYIFKMIN